MKLIKLFEQFISEEVELYQAGNAYYSYLDKDFKVLDPTPVFPVVHPNAQKTQSLLTQQGFLR